MNKQDILKWSASFFMLLILIGLLCYLTFIPVPTDNREIILTVLSVILGGAASALPNLFGDKDGETQKLKERVRDLEANKAVQDARYAELKEQYDRIIAMLIRRHLIPDDDSLPPLLPNNIG